MTRTYFNNQLLEHIKLGENNEVLSILQGANPCQLTSSNKSTFLHCAAEYGNKDVAQYLIDLGADVNAQTCMGKTPLMIAMEGNHIEVFKILLKANADIYMPDSLGQCVLGRAYRLPEMEINIKSAILDKVTLESLNKSQYVNSKAFHVDCPLFHFVSLRNAELTRVLLEKGSPVDAKDPKTKRTALHLAVEKLDVENVKLLVEYHADVNVQDCLGKRPLALISDYNDKTRTLEIVKILISAGVTLIDHEHSEIVVKSILSDGNKELVHTVLEGINLYIEDKYSMTPLDYMFDNHNPGVFEELQNFKLDVNNHYCNGKSTLLHTAAGKGNANAVEFLLKHGADVNDKNFYKVTPLCVAIDPFASVANGFTESYWRSRFDCIEILLENGADPQILTKDNYNNISAFSEPVNDLIIELMRPVLNHLALQEASGREIEQFMRSEIEKRPEIETIFDSSKQQLEEMKQIKIDESVNLFEFFVAKRISLYATNEILISNLTSTMKEYSSDSYYYRRLRERFLKLARLVAVNEVFVKFYNVSLINVAEKIVDYSYDKKLY